ncbi:PspC domain-containing protein [Lacihabitans sp. LS3-19]|uniref:PspC domain-containing protein n=1 Tax=Lacihabitans sp. LS3-19 TaxID=2487335 RepID=UPI0020CEBBD9|nr:PspC domain-containing protein [Lacihabitans sp. LS3-19]MCP9770544.1 PspC domain-containing protein [Lacihabitans sp. LS3-19]
MKKTLQITIGGLIFNIEEDAYAKLSQYLEAIKKYFSSYESCEEITQDIEGRIAEKFYEKSQNGGVIEMDDVDKIIKSMGTVSDFEAIQEDEDLSKEPISETSSETENPSANHNTPPTKFYRDGKNKALGGVLSGIAHRFEFDVVWARILFIVLGFGLIDIGIGFFIFVAYFVCWIAFPERNDLEENKKIKKFYRNPENKVLGGVATGLASYLKMDLVIIRVLFVISGFFLIGILLYIIFWIVAPTANTLTQKMELKGQAVTIENIESTIKTNSISEGPRQESAIAKLLLFPFRLVGIILKAFSRLLNPLGSIVKIFAGLLLLILGTSLAFAALVSTGAFFGVITHSDWFNGGHVIGLFSKDIPAIGGFFGFLALFIPAISIILVGISLLVGKRQGNRNFWLTILTLWLAGILGVSVISTKYAMNFSRSNSYEDETILSTPKGTLYLDAKEREFMDDDVFDTRVSIETSPNENLTLKQRFISKGRTKEEAIENSKKINYLVTQRDSLLIFPENFIIANNTPFRNQKVITTLYIPKNQRFKMTSNFVHRVYSQSWNLKRRFGIDWEDIQKYTFIMDDNGKVKCEDCPELTEDEKEAVERKNDSDDNFYAGSEFNEHGEFHKTVKVDDFENIKFGANYIVTIKQGTEASLEIYSNREEELNDIEAKVRNRTLEIEYDDPFRKHDADIHIYITTQKIKDLDISGASIVKVFGFENLDKLNIEMGGASKAAFQVKSDKIDIDASGASLITFKGECNTLRAELSGASELNTRDCKIENADIEAHGASVAKLGKIKNLRSDTSGGSSIERE